MSDELSLPEVPEASPDDPEDVSWALSTAEAMWARGDHLEGIKWVRRAAEAASEAENDMRALHLAKAAAELTGLISRMTRASVDIEELDPDPEPAFAAAPPVPGGAARPGAPLSRPSPASVTKQVATPSRPPAPLPSRTSEPPPIKGKPLGTNSGKGGSVRPPPNRKSEPAPARERDSKRPPRKSRENLDAAARQALSTPRRPAINVPAAAAPAVGPASVRPGAIAPASVPPASIPPASVPPASVPPRSVPPRSVPPPSAVPAAAAIASAAIEKAVSPNRVAGREIGNNDPTFVGHVDEIVRSKKFESRVEEPSADAWDASPTQDLTGDDLPSGPFRAAKSGGGDRATAVGVSREDLQAALARKRAGGAAPAPVSSSSPPATVARPGLSHSPVGPASPPAPGREPSAEPHDPGILTSQAVRVVVWRDPSGVHVAPAGTVVSAITVDAVLVALEPNADLTAWLSQRNR